MGFKGAAIGGAAGWFFGGALGALIGAYVGSAIEKQVSGGAGVRRPGTSGNPRRDLVFCASAAAMLAKLAKADGVVTADEIAVVERAFLQLGFSQATRAFAVGVFRRAKDDNHTIYEYARDFAGSVPSLEVREFLYGILWDVACADGRIDPNEMAILRQIPLALGIRPAWFEYYARERIRGYQASGQSSSGGRNAAAGDSLADAYALLGASASDDVETLRRKYRELAKKYHPDALRAQGLPDEMIGKANERMAKINAAWSTIKSARGI